MPWDGCCAVGREWAVCPCAAVDPVPDPPEPQPAARAAVSSRVKVNARRDAPIASSLPDLHERLLKAFHAAERAGRSSLSTLCMSAVQRRRLTALAALAAAIVLVIVLVSGSGGS